MTRVQQHTALLLVGSPMLRFRRSPVSRACWIRRPGRDHRTPASPPPLDPRSTSCTTALRAPRHHCRRVLLAGGTSPSWSTTQRPRPARRSCAHGCTRAPASQPAASPWSVQGAAELAMDAVEEMLLLLGRPAVAHGWCSYCRSGRWPIHAPYGGDVEGQPRAEVQDTGPACAHLGFHRGERNCAGLGEEETGCGRRGGAEGWLGWGGPAGRRGASRRRGWDLVL